jgi:hypothetical protein
MDNIHDGQSDVSGCLSLATEQSWHGHVALGRKGRHSLAHLPASGPFCLEVMKSSFTTSTTFLFTAESIGRRSRR